MNYSCNFISRWKDGSLPCDSGASKGSLIVNYDQTNLLYEKPDDYDAFVEWVSENWGGDNNCRLMDNAGEYLETAVQHLDRIDCSIREVS